MSQFLRHASLTFKVEVSDMFGTKSGKRERLAKARQIIERQGEVSPAELARQLGVPQSTVSRDLVRLHDQGVLLCEDEGGKLSLLERWFGGRRR